MKQPLAILLLMGYMMATAATAQTAPNREVEVTIDKSAKGTKGSKNVKEYVIEEKTNGKSEKTVIVIDGNTVTINGKPSNEYKGKKHIVIDEDIIIDGNRVISPRAMASPRIAGKPARPRAMLGVVSEQHAKGAKIVEVVDESAAEKAGLKSGDIITQINGAAVANPDELTEKVRSLKPDQEIDIAYLRDDKEKKVKAKLGTSSDGFSWSGQPFEMDALRNLKIEGPLPRGFGGDDMSWNFNGGDFFFNDRPKYGMAVEDNADGDGVIVNSVDADGVAAKAGLAKGDLITTINDKAIKNLDALRSELMLVRETPTLLVKVMRQGKSETLTMRVPKKIKTAEL